MNQIEFEIIDKFKNIDKTVENFLYTLLAEKEFSISHRNMPTLEDHKEFIKNNPYYMWSIIIFKNSMIGSIYILNDNSVGINLLKKYQFLKGDVISLFEEKFKPLPKIKSYRTNVFSFRISPDDEITKKLLIDKNYKIDSITFVKKS